MPAETPVPTPIIKTIETGDGVKKDYTVVPQEDMPVDHVVIDPEKKTVTMAPPRVAA